MPYVRAETFSKTEGLPEALRAAREAHHTEIYRPLLGLLRLRRDIVYHGGDHVFLRPFVPIDRPTDGSVVPVFHRRFLRQRYPLYSASIRHTANRILHHGGLHDRDVLLVRRREAGNAGARVSTGNARESSKDVHSKAPRNNKVFIGQRRCVTHREH